MPRRKILQTNFSAGELAPGLGMRQDTDQYQNGAKSLRNRRVLISGGTKRRPGSWWSHELIADGIGAEFIVNRDTQYVLVFSDGRMDAYLRDPTTGDLTASGSITSAPWTLPIVEEMDWVQSSNTMFLTHPAMLTLKILRTGPSTWVLSPFQASFGPAGRYEQPYLKVAPDDVTLAPSALTGTITLTASASWFVPAHYLQRIRYLQKEMIITAYLSPTSVTAQIVETLPPTQTLTVTSSANFAINEVVEGATSFAKGVVTGIPNATSLTVVITNGLTPFAVEDVTGPNGKTAISAVASATPAAVHDWDEQLFGVVHGYAACVELHRNRLCFAGHPAAPDYLIASSQADIYNFNVGDGSDGDAIIEPIGDAGASKIVGLHSAEQLLVLTDRGPYYCPEGPTAPFRPSSIAFLPFGSGWPITASAHALPFDGGVVFFSGSLAIVARPTGDSSRLWQADEVSLLSPHLIKTPDRVAVVNNFGGEPERYAFIRNSDGTLAVMQLVADQKIRNFTPWDTPGIYRSVVGIFGDLYVITRRTINGATKYLLERMDQSITLDAATQYADEAALVAATTRYGADAAYVTTADYSLGTYPLSIRTVPDGPYIAGLNYESVIETLPPVVDDNEGPAAGDMMRIVEAYAHVISSARFAANGTSLAAYAVTDDITEPPPLKSGPQRFQFQGWAREPTITISQPDPLPLEVLAIRSTVAY